MKAEKAIIYDHSCPMCRWYTGAFVKADLLQPQNRISFTELEKTDLHQQLDLHRSKHEIPLIDLDGGATIYGLDSLVYLLGRRFPLIPRLMRYPLIDSFFRRLYQLVSYNRRIIAASPKTEGGFDCTPDFNFKYRLTYIGIASGIALLMLAIILKGLMLPIWMVALVLLPFLISFLFSKERGTDWAGHWSTILLIGALTALPIIWLAGGMWLWGIVVLGLMVWQFLLRLRIMRNCG